jgi:tripartite-type tricarboxylate transporter receptor subunit TctC
MLKIQSIACGLALFMAMPWARAQTNAWPEKPVRIVLPYAAGGFSDIVVKLVASKLQERIGQTVNIDYKPGNNSIHGVNQVAKAPPDGYTFGLVIAAYAINSTLYDTLPYAPQKDITPVSLLVKFPMVAVVSAQSPHASVKALIEASRKESLTLQYGSSGVGSGAHLTTEMLNQTNQVRWTHVPYKGAGPALKDLIAGQITLMLDAPSALIKPVQEGSIRLIGVTSEKRLSIFPEVPTFEEQGFKGFKSYSWAGIIAPAGVDTRIVSRMADELHQILNDPQVRTQLQALGCEAEGSTPEAFARFLESDTRKWGEVARSIGLKLTD